MAVQQDNRHRAAFQQRHAPLLQRPPRTELEGHGQCLLEMAVEKGELRESLGTVRSAAPGAMQRDTGLNPWRQRQLTDEAEAGVAVLRVPLVVRMPILVPLADHQPVVDDWLQRVPDEVLDSGVDGGVSLQIRVDGVGIEQLFRDFKPEAMQVRPSRVGGPCCLSR
jgi:hypothetical protein